MIELFLFSLFVASMCLFLGWCIILPIRKDDLNFWNDGVCRHCGLLLEVKHHIEIRRTRFTLEDPEYYCICHKCNNKLPLKDLPKNHSFSERFWNESYWERIKRLENVLLNRIFRI